MPRLPGYYVLFTRSERVKGHPDQIYFLFRFILSSPPEPGRNKKREKGGYWIKKKIYIEKEWENDQTGKIRTVGRRRRKSEEDEGEAEGAASGVCIQLEASSSYANAANFPFYFISRAEICDLW